MGSGPSGMCVLISPPRKRTQNYRNSHVGTGSSHQGCGLLGSGAPTWTSNRAHNNGPICQNREYRQHRVHYFAHFGGPGRSHWTFILELPFLSKFSVVRPYDLVRNKSTIKWEPCTMSCYNPMCMCIYIYTYDGP